MGADGFFEVQRSDGDGGFRLMGEVDMAVADRLLDAVQPSIDEGHDVLLDLGGLTFVDSSGMHAIIKVGQRAAAHGRSVVLRFAVADSALRP